MASTSKAADTNVVVDQGQSKISDLWKKEDYWAIWLGFALLIIGMFMPKLGFTPFFDTATLAAGLATIAWVISARSHDPISWERATEKNRNT